MKKSTKILTLTVAGLFLFGSLSFAEYGKRERKFATLTEELGVTDEQEAALNEQMEQFAEKNKAVWEKMKAKKKELKDELEKPAPDRSRIDAIIGEIKELTGERLNNRVDKILAVSYTHLTLPTN